MMQQYPAKLFVEEWLNTSNPLTLEDFKGKVIVIEAFQMLCPGCVSHGLPQAQRVTQTFSSNQVAVLGLHTVFEHHQAQGSRAALEAFLHEYKIAFPVGIDKQSTTERLPLTMSHYQMQGTPTLLIFDKQGNYRHQWFGQISDMALGSVITQLQCEETSPIHKREEQMEKNTPQENEQTFCDDNSCDENRCDENGCQLKSN